MNSREPSVTLDQARSIYKQGKASEAIQLLRGHLQQHSSDRDAQELLAMFLYSARKIEEAKDAFHQLTRMDPKYSSGWVNLGAVKNLLKDFNGATKDLRKAIQIDKKCASAYYNLGIAQKALRSNSMAIAAYREAIRLAPKMPEPYANLANMYIEMKNLRQAVKVAEDGFSNCPDFKKIKVILDKAVALKEGIRRDEAPLGRLVNEEELARKQVRLGGRQLEATIRNEERDMFRAESKTARRCTKPIAELLAHKLPHQLHVLSMAAAQKDTQGEAADVFDEMQKTIGEIDRLRQTTREAISNIQLQLQKTDPGL